MKNILPALAWLLLCLMNFSCEGFLDEKPQKSILVPESALEYQAILDNYTRVNISAPLPFIYSDDFWTTEANLLRLSPWHQQSYRWSMNPYSTGEIPEDYFNVYRKIFTANVVLDKLAENPRWSKKDLDDLRGKALFWRAHGYFELAVLFLDHPKSASSEGRRIPARLSSALNAPVGTLNSQQAFDLILKDLEAALPLLEPTTQYPTQPSVFAGYGLLSRIHLYLGNYDQAMEYGLKVLEGNFKLMNYSSLNMNLAFPIQNFNAEIILFTTMASISVVAANNTAFIEPKLANSYEAADLRRRLFFSNSAGFLSFKGNYTGRSEVFTGVALDEVLLNLAEAKVRTGSISQGMGYLNQLLRNRIQNFKDLELSDPTLALASVLDHRRKSLVFRGLRWMDLKRFAANDSKVMVLERMSGGEKVTFETRPEHMQVSIPSNEIN